MSHRFVRAVALGGAAALGAGAATLVAPATLRAQPAGSPRAAAPTEVGIVRGRVVEAGSLRPVTDAQITIVGTTIGTVSNAAGDFTLPRVPAGARSLLVRRIGYGARTQAVNVPAGGDVRVDVVLAQAAAQLDQVVVTGTAQATTRRTLGNAITQLDVADLTEKSTLANVSDLLQSKSPGVQLIPGSGTAGASADIRIRGTSSLSGSNRPIVFIDGVRMNDGGLGNFGPSGAGIGGTFSQGVSALDAINPNDIESIEVIKGPAAATLYGADAAGGVIQILTKKGARNQGGVRWQAKAEAGRRDWALGIPDNYTTCTQARIDARFTAGVFAGQPQFAGCQGAAAGTVLRGNPLRDDPLALRAGDWRQYSASARGGGDRYSFYVSGDFNLDEGVFVNNARDRSSGRANFTYQPGDRLDFGVNTSYIRDRVSLPLSDDAGGGVIISATRGQPGRTYTQGGTMNTRGWNINLPEVAHQYDNRTETDRFITSGTVNYRPFTWMRHRFTAGLDYQSPLASIFYDPSSAFAQGDFPSGFFAQRTPQTRYLTFDYAGTLSNTLPAAFTSEFTVGAQGIKNRTRTVTATATGLPSGDFRLIQAATTVVATSGFSGQASLGYYAQEQIGWNNRLFVTGAIRADDNSAFGARFDRVFYPKASVSYVLSEEPALGALFERLRFDNFKLRYAYGQAGRAPLPFAALRNYGSARVVTGGGSVVSGLVPGAPGNETLEAERGIESEVGFDASLLNSRVSIEATYYSKRTEDALVGVSNAPSTGFTGQRFINFGTIKNAGLELGIRTTPIQRRSVTWDAGVNFTTIDNKMVRLAVGGVDQIIPFNPYVPSAFPAQIIKEGYPVASFWAVDVRRNADGSYVTTPSGAFVFDTVNGQPSRHVGSALPTYEGGITNTVTLFRNLRLYALIDFKGGHYIFNQRERNRNQAANRNSALFNDPSHPDFPRTALDTAYWGSNATAPWIQPADFVKLRDVSASYTLPEGVARRLRVQSATLVVAGNNLGFLGKRYPGIDPEVNFFGQGTLNFIGNFASFIRTDSYTIPMTRRITTAVNLTF